MFKLFSVGKWDLILHLVTTHYHGTEYTIHGHHAIYGENIILSHQENKGQGFMRYP